MRVGYEMVGSQRGGYNHLISNKREWNNCFIENAHKISMNLPGFILLEQTEKSLMFLLQVTSLRDWKSEHQKCYIS